tara:strand:- start:1532 stop:1825 length:294 start_codon:yes stop_codon:yes gene_type:complete
MHDNSSYRDKEKQADNGYTMMTHQRRNVSRHHHQQKKQARAYLLYTFPRFGDKRKLVSRQMKLYRYKIGIPIQKEREARQGFHSSTECSTTTNERHG